MIALIIGMLVSLIVTLVGTPLLIRLVHKLHYGQYIRQDGPQSHLVKRGTPTLGGVVINFAILLGWASSALYRYLRSGDVPSWSAALVLFAMLSMGLLGFIDDFAKVRKKQNEGLSVGGKFIGQFIFATIYAVLALLIPTKSGFPSAQAGISFIEQPFFNFDFAGRQIQGVPQRQTRHRLQCAGRQSQRTGGRGSDCRRMPQGGIHARGPSSRPDRH